MSAEFWIHIAVNKVIRVHFGRLYCGRVKGILGFAIRMSPGTSVSTKVKETITKVES